MNPSDTIENEGKKTILDTLRTSLERKAESIDHETEDLIVTDERPTTH